MLAELKANMHCKGKWSLRTMGAIWHHARSPSGSLELEQCHYGTREMRRTISNEWRRDGKSFAMRRRPSFRVGLAAPTVNRQSAYYRDLWKRAKAFQVSFKDDGWWDLWHMHFDWDGEGNKGRWARREHLRAAWRAFVRLQQQARAECRIDYQVFLNVSESDSASDALYFHTPNPNADNFPVSFDGSVALNHAPALLYGLVDLERYDIRREQFENSTWYVIVPRRSLLLRQYNSLPRFPDRDEVKQP